MNVQKRRVLIIDDEVSFTRLLKLNLHHAGRYVAEVVNDPVQAVAMAHKFQPDVILLDVMMPGMDGGEVARRLRESPEFKETPIVFLTAAVKRHEIESHGGTLGGLPFAAKPLDIEEVLECLDKACANLPHREAPHPPGATPA